MFVPQINGATAIIGAIIMLICRICDADLPSFITKCHRDANLDKCAEKVLNQIRPYLASGDFGNGIKTKPLDPLVMNKLSLSYPELNVTLSNLVISGPSNYQVKGVKVDPEKLIFKVKLFTPVYSCTAKYRIRLKLGPTDVQGEGDLKGNMTGLHIIGRLQLAQQGSSVKVVKLQNRLKIDGANIYFDNLFNGNRVLSQVGNELINAESQALLKIITPGFEKTMNEINIDIVNAMLKSATVDDLFL